MPAFGVFALDPKITEKIFNSLGLTELFRISLCSRRMRDTVRRLVASRPPRIVLTVDWDCYESSSITITTTDPSYDVWKFYDRRNHFVQYCCQPLKGTVIDGVELEMCCSNRNNTNFVTKSPEMSCLQVLPYLEDLFSAELDVTIRLENLECFEEIITSDCYPRFKKIWGTDGVATGEEMTMMLDRSCAKSFRVPFYVGKDFSYQKPLSFSTFALGHAEWFTRHNLLSLKARKVALERTNLKEEDFNDLIKQWLDSDNTDLEYVVMRGMANKLDTFGFGVLDFEKIIKDLPVFPSTEKRLAWSSYRNYNQWFVRSWEGSVDVRRKSDGMLATILKPRGKPGKDLFLFLVWHVFDPSLTIE